MILVGSWSELDRNSTLLYNVWSSCGSNTETSNLTHELPSLSNSDVVRWVASMPVLSDLSSAGLGGIFACVV